MPASRSLAATGGDMDIDAAALVAASAEAELEKRTGIHFIQLHKKKGLTLEHVPFIGAYAVTAYFLFTTIGVEYAEGLAKYSVMEPPEGEDFLPPCLPLPGEHMPSFMSRLSLGVIVILHALLLLAQHWSVAFHCWIKYTRVNSLKEATHARVVPPKHQGKTELVEIARNAKGHPFFKFQRQNYVHSNDEPHHFGFHKVVCPDALPLSDYTTEGLTRTIARARAERYGENKFEIVIPSFEDLYIEGLLQPFSVFQFFCVLLWTLEEYWQYSVFALFMMLMFEGTVVMQRRKNLTLLRGMNNVPRLVHVLRDGQWLLLSADKIVPGDIISVTKGPGTDEDVVPCDCLIMDGSVVVNEATLTGESVPQMKEAVVIDEDSASTSLDINNRHKVHVLWGGTKLLQHRASSLSTTPDGGCLCYVLRTGFDSSQGRLVRMIQFSSDKVTGNTKEALLLILILLVFALAASGYVLKRGIEDGRDKFELLIHCILIVTSVVPTELNMQMALAVNTSLITLMKAMVYCTEPFRIPLAGKVDTCLFDKTGTITTDELVAAGVVAISKYREAGAHYQLGQAGASREDAVEKMAMASMPLEPSLVIGGCHALVEIDGKTTGDPIEMTSLKAIKWAFDPQTSTSTPTPNAAVNWPAAIKPTVRILHRFHFASKLQRMSVLADVKSDPSLVSLNGLCVLSKGSPEMIGTLLKPGNKPSWYDATHRKLAKDGMRVIALAYRPLARDEVAAEHAVHDLPRSQAERDLLFGGFLAFRCLLRKDSRAVLTALKQSSHKVTMVTGDALLTGTHVATEVGITHWDKNKLLLLDDEGADVPLRWRNGETDEVAEPFSVDTLPELAKSFDLCMTGKALLRAAEMDEGVWSKGYHIRVFARMTPNLKEKLMISLKEENHFTLMCGDGANDVGALKQADVGVALLSGFGSANAKKEEQKSADSADSADSDAPPGNNSSTTQLAAVQEEAQPEKKKKKMSFWEQQKQMQEEINEVEKDLVSKGASPGFMTRLKASQLVQQRKMQKQRELMKKSGGSGLAAHAAMLASDDLDDGSVPMVKLGDASIAAPFTSKKPSIQSTLDIIRQGRCTLVTSTQMYQILALNCLISSYSLSALYLDGVKSGDHQMTAMGILSTIAFLSISRASPLQQLSSVRPLNSIFHPALFFSIAGQFAIHLTCMMYIVHITKGYMPDNWQPSLEGKFEPNLINSVVFLTKAVQEVGVFVVNYKGQPFMTSITKNKFLLYALAFAGCGAFVAASNILPEFNKLLQLVEYPSEGFRIHFMTILFVNIVGTFVWDRIMLAIFAPKILFAGLKSITRDDLKSVAIMLVIVYLVINTVGSMDSEFWDEVEKARLEYEQAA